MLTNGDRYAYALENEIVVSRSVIIMGHPATLPTIDAQHLGAPRVFRVTVGRELGR